MPTMKLPGGLEFTIDPSKDCPDLELEQSIRDVLTERAKKVEQFITASAPLPDPTQYELIEEWDRTERKIRWYYRKREP